MKRVSAQMKPGDIVTLASMFSRHKEGFALLRNALVAEIRLAEKEIRGLGSMEAVRHLQGYIEALEYTRDFEGWLNERAQKLNEERVKNEAPE